MEAMERLVIKKTPSTPEAIFEVDGNLTLNGRIITDNATLLFQPMMDWINKLECQKVIFNINLEYLNTSASMQLYQMLKNLADNCMVEELSVIWHYEEDDEDHLETGQVYEERLKRIKFRYLKYA